jgi:hypothetical protein
MPRNRSGGAPISQVAALHEAVVNASLAEIKRLQDEGEPIPPALLTAALRICEGSGVSATLDETSQTEELASIVAGLRLTPPPMLTTFRP